MRFNKTALDRWLRLAMSVAEAKATLGLFGTPSPEEISKAYKQMALKHHPDRGGDLDKMVEVNIARDVLLPPPDRKLDKPAPKTQNNPYQPPSSGWSDEDRVKPPAKIKFGTTFAEAAGTLPSGVEWLVVSDYSLTGAPSDFTLSLLKDPEGKGRIGIVSSVNGYLVVGIRQEQCVCALLERTFPNQFSDLILTEWAVADIQVVAMKSWLASPEKVVKAFLSSCKPKLAKDYSVSGRMGFHFLDRKTALVEKDVLGRGKGISLSVMAPTLNPDGAAPKKGPPKYPNVELVGKSSEAKFNAWLAIPKDRRPVIMSDEEFKLMDISLVINGKSFDFSQATLDKMPRILTWALWGTPPKYLGKRSLNKVRNYLLSYILEHLLKAMAGSEPPAFIAKVEEALAAALEVEAALAKKPPPANRR